MKISDNGCGIPPERLEHIFEPFQRERNTTFSGVYGTGLGLTIARNLARQMGGDVVLDSQPGIRTVFAVRLRRYAGRLL